MTAHHAFDTAHYHRIILIEEPVGDALLVLTPPSRTFTTHGTHLLTQLVLFPQTPEIYPPSYCYHNSYPSDGEE